MPAKYFTIVNTETGDAERVVKDRRDPGHGACGLYALGGDPDLSIYPVPDGYMLVELTGEEYNLLIQGGFEVERDGETVFIDNAHDILEGEVPRMVMRYAIDPKKAKGKIEEREKIEVPVFVDGFGGPEFSHTEERPGSVVVEAADRKSKGAK